MKKLLLFILIASSLHNVLAQSTKKNAEIIVAFYNTEKFYDIIDNPDNEDDNEFTPEGVKKWDNKRYLKKVEMVAKALSSISENNPPAVLGLCEIENNTILDDIIKNEKLVPFNYKYIYKNTTNDLDIALIYRNDIFKALTYKKIPVNSNDPEIDLQSILYVKGIFLPSDTVFIFVNHWKSRKGANTNDLRQITAKTLKEQIEELFDKNENAKILVMGDFNDEPTDKSIFRNLEANNKRKNTDKDELYNFFYDINNLSPEGTIYRKDKWYLFDQIMVSQELVNEKKGLTAEYNSGSIFKQNWLLTDNSKADELIPKETYGGDTYIGGASDHLPVYVIMKRK